MAYNSNPPKQQYTANVGQTIFPFLFKIFFETDIKVYLTPLATGVTAQIELTTDYTVAISGDNGGSITLLSGLASGDIIVIQRELSIDRLVDYQTNGDLLAETLNNDQDYQTYLVADGTAKLEDTFSVEPGSPNIDTTLPAPEADAYIVWSSDGKSLENDTTGPIDSQTKAWESEAAQLTSDSYATEAEDVFVNLWTSDGDGTFTATPTTEYSSLHWAAKSKVDGDKVLKAGDTMTGNLEAPSMSIGGDYLSAYSLKNKLINGRFNIWERGESFLNVSNNTYTADRWVLNSVGATNVDITKRVYDEIAKGYGIAVYTPDTSTFLEISQRIENTRNLRADTEYTISFYYSSNMELQVVIGNNYGDGGSSAQAAIVSTFSASGSITKYTITFNGFYDDTKTVGANSYAYISIRNAGHIGQFNIYSAQLEEGSVATPFETRLVGHELDLCKRYARLSDVNTRVAEYTYEMRDIPTVSGASAPYLYTSEL